MSGRAYAEVGLYVVVLIALAAPLGRYIHAVLEDGLSTRWRPLWALESGLYGLCGIDCHAEMGWRAYAGRLLLFDTLGALSL